MRGEASRIADRESRDSLAPKLRDTREDAWRIGNELFTITKVLDDSIQLERALTDPSRPVADKVAVLKELLGDNAHPMTMEIMTDLVSRRWSRARDIANAVEDFGVDAMMYYADATDATLQVSIELSELHSALLNLPVVRAKLYDYQATSEARVKLFREVFSGKTLNKVTMRLAEHATCNLRRRRYLETIQWLINKFSRHMGESMVTVTTATPLKKEQIKRLVEVYSARCTSTRWSTRPCWVACASRWATKSRTTPWSHSCRTCIARCRRRRLRPDRPSQSVQHHTQAKT